MKSVVNEAFLKEIRTGLETRLNAVDANVEKRLDAMNKYCVEQLTKQDKRARDVQGYLLREVKIHIRNALGDMDVTIEAMINVLADSGVVIDGFIDKVNAAKPAVMKRRQEEDSAKMEAQIAAQKAAAEARAGAQPTTDTPAPVVSDSLPAPVEQDSGTRARQVEDNAPAPASVEPPVDQL